jgi:hypothetical protein
MKVLKRRFAMTKEEVEENIRLIPYHHKHVSIMTTIQLVRADQSKPSTQKLKIIEQLRKDLAAEWKKHNEVQ